MSTVIDELDGHRVEVGPELQFPEFRGRWRARCECGWGGRLCRGERAAVRSGAMHCAREDASAWTARRMGS
jgi:hypothetical protein